MDKKATIYDFWRICKNYWADLCIECPLAVMNNETKRDYCLMDCDGDKKQIDKANKAILKWCEEHRAKTYTQDFLEKFPKARTDNNGIPIICRNNIYFGMACTEKNIECCSECWEQFIL